MEVRTRSVKGSRFWRASGNSCDGRVMALLFLWTHHRRGEGGGGGGGHAA